MSPYIHGLAIMASGHKWQRFFKMTVWQSHVFFSIGKIRDKKLWPAECDLFHVWLGIYYLDLPTYFPFG